MRPKITFGRAAIVAALLIALIAVIVIAAGGGSIRCAWMTATSESLGNGVCPVRHS